MTATSEQAEVGKQTRVVGEVAVGKQVEEREKTVKDTVRRTEVEVEEVGRKSRKVIAHVPPERWATGGA
jgi:stress response protein YsnF